MEQFYNYQVENKLEIYGKDNLEDTDTRIKESEIYEISNTHIIAQIDEMDEDGE